MVCEDLSLQALHVKGGISFLSQWRRWIIRRSYCGHFRSFDVLTAAGCRGGAAKTWGLSDRRPGVSRWAPRPFTQLEKKRIPVLAAGTTTVETSDSDVFEVEQVSLPN